MPEPGDSAALVVLAYLGELVAQHQDTVELVAEEELRVALLPREDMGATAAIAILAMAAMVQMEAMGLML